MTTKKLNKLHMYLAVQDICNDTPAAWNMVPAFVMAFTDFLTRISIIQSFAQTQSQNKTGIAMDKTNARVSMCALALPVAKAVHAYAIKTNNQTLAKSVDFSPNSLIRGRDTKSADRCQIIYNAANTNLAALADYKVTAVQLTALENAIGAYNQLVSKPRDSRAQGKTITTNTNAQFKAADDDLIQLDDLLGQLTNKKFVGDFTNARIIVDTAATHASPKKPTPKTPPAEPPAK